VIYDKYMIDWFYHSHI